MHHSWANGIAVLEGRYATGQLAFEKMIGTIREIQIKTTVITVCTYSDGCDLKSKQRWQRARVDKAEDQW